MSEVRVPMNTRKEAVINRILSATRQNDQCQQQQKQQRVPLKPQPPLLPALGSALGNSQSKSQQGPRPVMFFGIHRFQEAQTLVKKLRSSNERERSAASKALLKYCRSITKLHTRYCQSQVGLEWQIAAGSFGVVEMAVELIGSDDPEVQLQAIKVLGTLVVGRPANQSIAGSMGAVKMLLQAVQSRDQELQMQSAAALGKMSSGCETNQSEAAALGAITVFLKLAQTEDAVLQKRALLTLEGLVQGHEVNQCEMIRAGAIPALQRIIQSAEAEVDTRKQASATLGRIYNQEDVAYNKSKAHALLEFCKSEQAIGQEWQDEAREAGFVNAIINITDCGDAPMQIQAIQVLRDLVSGHECNKAAAGQAGAIALLLRLSQSPNVELQLEALKTLEYLVNNCSPNQLKAAFAGGVEMMMELARSADASTQIQALSTLGAIVDGNDGNKSAAGDAGAVDVVLQLTRSADATLQQAAMKTLKRLVLHHSSNKLKAASAGGVEMMMELARSADASTQIQALSTLGAIVHLIYESQSLILVDALALCTTLFTAKNAEIQWASLDFLDDVLANHESNRSLAGCDGALSSILPLIFAKDAQSSRKLTRVKTKAMELLVRLVRCHADNQSEAGRLGIVDLCVQHALATSDQVEHKWYIYCLESLVRGHHVNQSLAVEAGAVSLCLSHVQGGCLKFEAGYKAAMQAAGGLNLTYFIVLLEVTRAGKMQPGQIEALRRVALHENNDALLQFIDFSDNGTIERLCNSSSALISRMLQSALPPNPLLRANRNANPLHAAPTASQWARGMYAPASRLNHFVTLYFSTTLEVLPMSTAQRQLLLPLCGMLQKLAHRLAHSTHSPTNAVSGNRSQATLLTKTLGITLVYRFLKTRFLQRINAAPVLEQRVADEGAKVATVTASAAS